MITETEGHDKRGKVIKLYYGCVRVQNYTKETIFTNNYRSKKLAEKKLKELEQKFSLSLIK
jgi:hypothetical protein